MSYFIFFFFNDTATTEIYTLSLHDALPIFHRDEDRSQADVDGGLSNTRCSCSCRHCCLPNAGGWQYCAQPPRSEEHTSEIQSRQNLVCRLLLEKKKKTNAVLIHNIIISNTI